MINYLCANFAKTLSVSSAALAFSSLLTLLSVLTPAQERQVPNNPFSPSPQTRTKVNQLIAANSSTLAASRRTEMVADSSPRYDSAAGTRLASSPSISAVNDPNAVSLISATETYKIGNGDLLSISIVGAPRSTESLEVSDQGFIDYPLANQPVKALGMRVDELAGRLSSMVKVFPNAKVGVKITKYRSHTVTISGLVDRPGVTVLQREAVPLYVINALAGPLSGATRVLIRQGAAGSATEYDLRSTHADNIIVSAGSILDYVGGVTETGK